MNLREAEIELYGVASRMSLDDRSALYVLLKEYERLKVDDELNQNNWVTWEPPVQLP